MYSELFLFLLALGLTVGMPIATIWLAISHVRLKRQVADLSARLLEPTAAVSTTPETALSDPPETERPKPPPPLPQTRRKGAPRAFVFRNDQASALLAWLQANWFYVAAALSLALAGVFLVKYGVEHGLLPPLARVLGAAGLGAALIGAGEVLRRRAQVVVGAAFSGAGLVAIFAAGLAARQLYGLISPEGAFAAFLATAALGVLLGWTHGAFLSAIGLIGAGAAPFVTGAGGPPPAWLPLYFAGVAGAGLAIDAVKRSAWLSALALIVATSGAAVVCLADRSLWPEILIFGVVVFLMTALIPNLNLVPRQAGPMLFGPLHRQGPRGFAEFPTRLAGAGVAILIAAVAMTAHQAEIGFWLALATLAGGLAAVVVWFRKAPAFSDLALPILAGFPAVLAWHGHYGAEVFTALHDPLEDVTASPPMTLTLLTAIGLALTGLLAWRSEQEPGERVAWAALAASAAPATVGILALIWRPLDVLSANAWAAHALGVAAVFTVLAGLAFKRDGEARARVAIYALPAIAGVAYAASILTTKTPLTLAFAAIALAAAWLDRRFDIKPLSWIAQAAILAVGYRLFADPGIGWAMRADLWDMGVAYLGSAAIFAATGWAMKARQRTKGVGLADSAAIFYSALFACLLLYRMLEDKGGIETHWSAGLLALIWLGAAAVQGYRSTLGGPLAKLRLILAGAFALVGLTWTGLSASMLNPLFTAVVVGPPVADSLLVAYGLPGLLLAAAAMRPGWFGAPKGFETALAWLAAAPLALYVCLQTRRLWHGADIQLPGVLDGELYTYTVLMIAAGAALLFAAFKRRSAGLRRVGLAAVGLAIAKVFLVD